jgi:hypothetical protein
MPKVLPGWHKSDSRRVRLLNILASHKFDYLSSARALRWLANVSTDPETKHKASSDSQHLFGKFRWLRKHKVIK